jgi:site-specific DNA-methyltransferase (adenine-specific)
VSAVALRAPELKVWTENLLAGAHSVPDCSVDMIFTSPPYKRKDGYSLGLMEVLGEVAGRVLRPGGRFFMNFGQLREGFARPFGPTDLITQVEILKRVDKLESWLKGPGEVLSRGHSSTITMKSPTMTYCWEPIFTFFKPPELALNRLSIGCKYADKSNLRRGTRGKHGDLKCAGDTWWIPYKTTGATKKKATSTMGNAYSFPVELPLRAIKVSNLARGCTVFDPFMGSGTVAVAAARLGMHAWGIELDAEKAPVIEQRWKQEVGMVVAENESPRVWICSGCAERETAESRPERCKVCGAPFVDVGDLEVGSGG